MRALLGAIAFALLAIGGALAQPVSSFPQASTPLSGSETLYIIQDGASKQITAGNLKNGGGNLSVMESPSGPPSSICGTGSFATAFSCDLSRLNMAIGTNITGAATLGQPTTGYVITPNLSSNYTYFQSSSGFNSSTSGNGGRTAGIANFTSVNNIGQGDNMAWFGNVFVNSTKPGATSFLAEPAGEILAGQLGVGCTGCYMEGIGDIDLSDDGFDAAGIGFVTNLFRTVNTAAIGQTWIGDRIQSVGTKPVDAFFSGTGAAGIGLDLSGMTSSQVGIALPRGIGIYGNVTNTGNFPISATLNLGTDEIVDQSSGWQFVYGGVAAMSVTASNVQMNVPVALTQGATVSGGPMIIPFGTPASSAAVCSQGQIEFDAAFVYTCVATNTWRRAATSAF